VIRQLRQVQTRNVAAKQESGCAHWHFYQSAAGTPVKRRFRWSLLETCHGPLTCSDLDGGHFPLACDQPGKAHPVNGLPLPDILALYFIGLSFPPSPSTTQNSPPTTAPRSLSCPHPRRFRFNPKHPRQTPRPPYPHNPHPSPLRIFALFSRLFSPPSSCSLTSTCNCKFAVAETSCPSTATTQPKRRQQFTLVWWHRFLSLLREYDTRLPLKTDPKGAQHRHRKSINSGAYEPSALSSPTQHQS
jgi:hypothetical protein